jgi:hypothetical protein
VQRVGRRSFRCHSAAGPPRRCSLNQVNRWEPMKCTIMSLWFFTLAPAQNVFRRAARPLRLASGRVVSIRRTLLGSSEPSIFDRRPPTRSADATRRVQPAPTTAPQGSCG